MAPILPSLHKTLKLKTDEARPLVRPAIADEISVYEKAESRAKASKGRIAFTLSRLDFDLLVTRANGRCEDTDMEFEQLTNSTGRYRDNWISIDRIENDGPYSLENCRLVTAAANYARGDRSIQDYHVQRLLYFAFLGMAIDDKFLLSRGGVDPNRWLF
ncbi:hypothetical protein [Devosia sp.]|uniref:hypothetical protein n=1 Tax=Devosia sp. TaxID=1871048 RepID=UPI0019E25812|nr:hypothetical protein [Devosia sp.]MBE0580007.1 hypothetical protein [Devosia sp.]